MQPFGSYRSPRLHNNPDLLDKKSGSDAERSRFRNLSVGSRAAVSWNEPRR